MNLGIERAFENNDKLTLVYCFIFLVITFVKLKYPKMFWGLLRCLYSKNVFLDFSKELQKVFSVFKSLIFIVQNLIFSVFIYLVTDLSDLKIDVSPDVFFLKIFIMLTSYLSMHYLFSLMVSKIFNFSEIFKAIRVLKFCYLKIVAFILFPVLVLFTYLDIENTKFASILLSSFFLVLLMLRVVLLLVKNNNLIFERLFYFIVYLCTLEIAPTFLIFKVMVKKLYFV